MIGLQITRIQKTDPDIEKIVEEKWLIRAWDLGHGCDALVSKLKPPYETHRFLLGDYEVLDVYDATDKVIAHTEWKADA